MSSKDRVLEFLEHNKEDYISGEYMAESLGLSRTAVWKAIKELRNQGYVIEASSKKGYILAPSNDIISESGILAELSEYCPDKHYEKKEKILSAVISEHGMIQIHETLDSTNRTAKELAIAGAPGGTVVIARSQTLGRGRREHEFFSPEGGIYMSIILTPDMLPSLEPDVVTALAGVSVCEAVHYLCGIEPRIKPVNDLFVGDKKICGILTESGTEFDTGTVQWIVIGIGINFDSDISRFPKELQSIAGALFEPGKAKVTKNRLIAAIICNLAGLSAESTREVLKAYNDRLI
jgi:BirA family biotin operon repressor/biotin-[acetyl-CoA-carboxylase] ligase